MMKILVIMSLLVVPAAVYGAGSLSLLDSTGASSLSVEDVTLPIALSMKVDIATGYNDISSVSFGLIGNTGLSVSATPAFQPNYSTWAVGNRFFGAVFPAGGYNLTASGGFGSGALDFGNFNGGGGTEVVAGDGTVETFTLNIPSGLALGDYVIGFASSDQGEEGTIVAWSALNSPPGAAGELQEFENLNGFTLTITPEPATMLLLAGALPFLRRRTA